MVRGSGDQRERAFERCFAETRLYPTAAGDSRTAASAMGAWNDGQRRSRRPSLSWVPPAAGAGGIHLMPLDRSADEVTVATYVRRAVRVAAMVDPEASTPRAVADLLTALASVGSRVALLERSRLGEFSWAFVYAITDIAERLFNDEAASGTEAPIVHVVAEGIGYHIWDDDLDQVPRRRIMVVAFPRHLRHHVLLHTIFGHELGHSALKSGDRTMSVLFGAVIPAMEKGPLQDAVQMRAWMQRNDAPGTRTERARERLRPLGRADPELAL